MPALKETRRRKGIGKMIGLRHRDLPSEFEKSHRVGRLDERTPALGAGHLSVRTLVVDRAVRRSGKLGDVSEIIVKIWGDRC